MIRFIIKPKYYYFKYNIYLECEIMRQCRESDFEYRNGDSGVKYLMRGPSIDWGVIRLKPGEYMGSKSHGHNEIDETFYFVEGNGGVMIIDDNEYKAPQGSVFLVEQKEMHNIRNDSNEPIKIVFIKGEYKPDDKIE
ncbi:MAG: cupin domain-containing protein [Candidatus Lokiarchaeota archaeon]|nr:cupin domain-containing protein [Candidatus Lokiarchaeota archaeon]MBD3340263.1 cupin domain-containing protein [Candidatus Lokiarchaeota archaeon]